MTVFKAVCTECEWEFEFESPEVNEIVVCQDCKLNLLVVEANENTKSVKLELTETEADDWGQ